MSNLPIKRGDYVEYVGNKGHAKLAVVTNTTHTVTPGTSLPELSGNQLHLGVWTESVGTFTPRHTVPYEADVIDNIEFQNEDGVLVGYWRFI